MAIRDADSRHKGGDDADIPDASDASETTGDEADDHLSDLPDGCGCAEVWTHLSEHRE